MNQDRNIGRLTARSVVASMLLGTQPPRLPGAVLVRAGELFGITEGTTRVALSRMVAAGELASEDGWYSLADERLLARQARQEASRAAATRRWDESWIVVVVTADRRSAAARVELRDALLRSRLAELREGVWLRPDNTNLTLPRVVDEQCTTMRATDVDPAVARRLWDLKGWQRRTRELRAEMRRLIAPLQRGDSSALAEGFIVSAAVLRHFQADPLLPDELLPAQWPGSALRAEYDRFDTAHRAVLRDWFRSHAT